MRKLILAFIVFTFIGCSNDDDNEVDNDYSTFLNRTRPQFSGELNNIRLFWEFNVGTYQINSGFFNRSGDPDDPNRILRFILIQDNGKNQFEIRTPAFDTSSEVEFDEVFGLGLKKLGDSDEDYQISILDRSVNYQICNSSSNYNVEVLKTEVTRPEGRSSDVLKVWFKIDTIEFDDCDLNTDSELTNGLVLAEFIGFKSE